LIDMKASYRSIAELFGIKRWSKPGLENLDNKLQHYLNIEGGFFIEAGANDGYRQSNTYYLEKIKGWSGILVEPIPEQYLRCVRLRKKSAVYNCALVSDEYEQEIIQLIYADLMTPVDHAAVLGINPSNHAAKGVEVQKNVSDNYYFSVPAMRLEEILIIENPPLIDFFSLDVEGFELEVLKGMNLERFAPRFILVEVRKEQDLIEYLSGYGYEAVNYLTHHDLLFRSTRQN
jgi:FkbM family methyltransferase